MPQPTNYEADSPAPPSPQSLASWYAQGMSDGLGDRLLMFDNSAAPSLELLRFRSDLAHAPEFEAALREHVQRLARFQHPAFARVRSVQRLESDGDLALISNYTAGKRLSEVLHRVRGPRVAGALIRQLGPALAQFQHENPGVSHGLLSPDRIIVSPEAQLTIVEHVVGPAIDALNLGTAELASIGIALPPSAGATPRLDVATDWYQLGIVALSALIGRPVTASELPHLEALLDQLCDAAGRGGTPLSPAVRRWLDRILQISGDRIESGADARAALDELLHKEQARDSRRVESSRLERAEPSTQAPPTPAPPVCSHEVRAAAVDRVVAGSTIAASPPHTHKDAEPEPRPIAAPQRVPTPARPHTNDQSIFEVRAAAELRQRPPQARAVSNDETLSPFEREVLAGRMRLVYQERPAAGYQAAPPPPPPQRLARSRISGSVVAALALIVVVEAGAIGWLARALWLAPPPAMAMETDASGDAVHVNSHSTGPAALQLTAAPDLDWVRVTSPATEGIVGAKVKGSAGVVRISSPIALKVLEGSRQLGSVPGADLKLPPGRHEIELVNVPLGYRSKQVLEVEAGETVSIHVAPPYGWVEVDAAPWAEVTIDGQAMGRTPIGPLPLALGEHTITFQHPAGSTDRQRVTVKSEETIQVIGKLRF